MRYNTGNPVGPDGSSDPRDLYDTVGIADLLVNGPLGEYLSRLGVPLRSWRGIMQQVAEYLFAQGYESIYLTYGPGVIVERQTQLVQRDGELYRVIDAEDLPLTLTGTWATDAPKLQAVGDAALRQLLSSSSGTNHIGRGSETLEQSLQGIEDDVSGLSGTIDSKVSGILDNMTGKDLTPAIVDMHFGTLCGTGWLGNAVEIGGNFPTPTTIAAPSPATSTQIKVTDPSIFRVGQLICYVGTSTTWFAAVIKSIAGDVFQLDRQIPEAVVAGALIIFFYANDAHPNIYGYKAIADDTLRQLTRKEELAYIGKNYEIWAPYVGTETITGVTLGAVTTASYKIPGTSTNANRSAKVDVTDANQGAKSKYVALDGGLYRTHVIINCGERSGGFSGAVGVSIEERLIDGTSQVIATTTVVGFSGIKTVDLSYCLRPGSSVRVLVISLSGGPASFYIGQMKHLKFVERVLDLDHGTIVYLGDSWINSTFLVSRMQERLPNATHINAGVSGNRVSQMIARFSTDVAPHNPHTVFNMGGTNDYYASVTAKDFEQQINQLHAMEVEIGAQPITWTASVGDATYAPIPGERLSWSRDYANNVNYHQPCLAPDWVGGKYRTANVWSGSVSVVPGTPLLVGVIPAQTIHPAIIRTLFGAATGLQYKVGYASIIDTTTLVDPVTFGGGQLINGVVLPRTDTAARFILITIENPTGSAVPTSLVADIAWVDR